MSAKEIEQSLARLGLAAPGAVLTLTPLSGGVSSDIWKVDLPSGPVCVKRALPRLRVAMDWQAPVERNRYERLWMQTAARFVPHAAPAVLAADDAAGLFVMEYFDPARHPAWKDQLRQGRAEPAFAAQVGAALAAIHAATAGRDEIAQHFATDAIFHAIRLEPYLLATADRHPDLSPLLHSLERRTAQTRLALVHGDVSPKNILAGPQGPIFLDAECAWYGDPAFDLAFCLNHLLLKCVWVPQAKAWFLECFEALARAYLAAVQFEGVESRAATLLPALLLARVDGKSPVEYLTEPSQKALVRSVARKMLLSELNTLGSIRETWQRSST